MTIAADLVRLFNRINARMGAPTLRIYAPVDEWTLDAGVSYTPISDTFADGDGDPVTVDYTEQTYTTAAYVPTGGGQPVMMMLPGATEADSLSVAVIYSSAIAAALTDAWGVEVPGGSGNLYRVNSRRSIPDGVATPAFLQIGLVQRGE